MPRQFVRPGWPAALCQVGRTGNDNAVHRRQFTRHHALVQVDAAADRHIETFPDQVDLAVLDVQVGHDGRVAAQEFSQHRHEIRPSDQRRHRDLERPARLAGAPARGLGGFFDALPWLGHFLQVALALAGQVQLTGGALEQAYAQVLLEAGYVLADCGRAQAKPARGRRKTALLGAIDEGYEMADRFRHGAIRRVMTSRFYTCG